MTPIYGISVRRSKRRPIENTRQYRYASPDGTGSDPIEPTVELGDDFPGTLTY